MQLTLGQWKCECQRHPKLDGQLPSRSYKAHVWQSQTTTLYSLHTLGHNNFLESMLILILRRNVGYINSTRARSILKNYHGHINCFFPKNNMGD